jgi:hypothetical protein
MAVAQSVEFARGLRATEFVLFVLRRNSSNVHIEYGADIPHSSDIVGKIWEHNGVFKVTLSP